MSDVFSKAKRSHVMSRIRGRGNKDTELALVQLMRAHGIKGWRRNQPVFGRPDFVFPRERVAVFVDGCFWHGCLRHSPPARWLRKSAMPAAAGSRKGAKAQRSGKRFWREKLAANQRRDRRVNRTLRRQGWRVVRIWEHELAANPARCIRRVRSALRSSRPSFAHLRYSDRRAQRARPTPDRSPR